MRRSRLRHPSAWQTAKGRARLSRLLMVLTAGRVVIASYLGRGGRAQAATRSHFNKTSRLIFETRLGVFDTHWSYCAGPLQPGPYTALSPYLANNSGCFSCLHSMDYFLRHSRHCCLFCFPLFGFRSFVFMNPSLDSGRTSRVLHRPPHHAVGICCLRSKAFHSVHVRHTCFTLIGRKFRVLMQKYFKPGWDP